MTWLLDWYVSSGRSMLVRSSCLDFRDNFTLGVFMTVSDWGLVVALVSFGVTGIGFLIDGVLWKIGYDTFSERIWFLLKKWRWGLGPFPIWLIIIIVWTSLIPIGLLIHFLTGEYN